jgi:aminoglycoside phosphotransferase (APT) family kinase protein
VLVPDPDPLTDPLTGPLAGLAPVLEEVCRRAGLDGRDARLLRRHASTVILLPRAGVVVRLVSDRDDNTDRADRAVMVAGWLARRDYPTVRPAHPQPIQVGGLVATVWDYLPAPEHRRLVRPATTVMGHLLRDLHALPPPPFVVPAVAPFGRLAAALATDRAHRRPVLSPTDQDFVAGRVAELDHAASELVSELGVGLIHGDLHLTNLLPAPGRSPYGWVLADWDPVRTGPREVDLIQLGAPGNPFGLTEQDRRAFTDAYGYDVTGWAGWTVLRDIRELHSLAAYLRVAETNPRAAAQLHHRLRSLRTGDRNVRWQSL